jgi:hypothetical protein
MDELARPSSLVPDDRRPGFQSIEAGQVVPP